MLSLRGISKAFPGVVALADVSLEVGAGETHVLLGENGAGKSTLVKVIAGIHAADEGTMLFNGKNYQPESPRAAATAGIRMIHQELSVLNNLTIAENIFIERLPQRGGVIDYGNLNRAAAKLLKQVGLDADPKLLVGQLSIAQQQMVEIARALSSAGRLIIMDEPTASLTDHEIDTLFGIIKQLNADGVSIIYISHRLQEIYRIGHRFTVLRNGKTVGGGELKDYMIGDLVKLMVGRTINNAGARTPERQLRGEELLRLDAFQTSASEHSVSFSVHAGEIVGIAGLVGSGRTELLRAIYGADTRQGGLVFIEGRQVRIRSPRDAVHEGFSLVTENRKEEGLLLEQSCAVNITITDLAQVTNGLLLDFQAEREAAEQGVRNLRVQTPSIRTVVRNLSGGNQQKIVLAKWIFRGTSVLMVDEPTRGIDVGARQEIYELLRSLAAEGRAILIVSSDLEELTVLCDRIMVLSDGRLTGELAGPPYDQEQILRFAFQEYLEHNEQATQI